jgi:hypothetical protein
MTKNANEVEHARSPVFTARNCHAATCGIPPHTEADPGRYCGYFENQFGEQWVFVYEPASDRATLRGGDAGWDRAYEVTLGAEDRLAGAPTLSVLEEAWLRVCLMAARARKA